MSNHKPKNREEWICEADYVSSVNPFYPGPDFRHDPSVFAEYCEMQSRFCALDGFNDLSKAIIQPSEMLRGEI